MPPSISIESKCKVILFSPSSQKVPTIYYSQYLSPLGEILLFSTEKYLCGLHVFQLSLNKHLKIFQKKYPEAQFIKSPKILQKWGDNIFSSNPIYILLRGTPFQEAVWKSLLSIPYGITVSYKYIANSIGKPTAFRAVANAIGQNPISYLVPCHRVIYSDGKLGGFRWGLNYKKKFLSLELSSHEKEPI